MPVTTIRSEEEYFKAIKEDGVVSAIHFVAPWDESCKQIAPKYKAFSENPRWNKDIRFFRVDDVAMDAGVELAPTFRFYKDGAKIKEYVGSSSPALERTLGALLNGH
ncbi:hypothetical protein JCM10213v2_007417 [Rhodosporidiobolus nylandii]